MGILTTTGDVASATTATAGALAAAAANGVVGATNGAVKGIGEGLGTGARSTPAAILGVAALGVTGIIDWPVLLAGAGAVLLLRQLRNNPTPTTATPSRAHTKPTANTSTTPAKSRQAKAPAV